MKIRFKTDHTAGDGTKYEKGKTYDVANEGRAALWVRSGVAEKADPPAKPDADKPAAAGK